MQTFTIGVGHRWWVRVFGGNPLVRASDRVEVFVFSVAILLTVVAVPIAGAIGTFVHDERVGTYAEEAQTRHQVVATATEPGTIVAQPTGVSFTARAAWDAFGHQDEAVIRWPRRPEIGDQQDIWVNDAGELVGPPSPPSRADVDAVAAAILFWFTVACTSAGLTYIARRLLNRWRYAQWDQHIDAFRANDGKTNHQ
jgi:hypothetical protein